MDEFDKLLEYLYVTGELDKIDKQNNNQYNVDDEDDEEEEEDDYYSKTKRR